MYINTPNSCSLPTVLAHMHQNKDYITAFSANPPSTRFNLNQMNHLEDGTCRYVHLLMWAEDRAFQDLDTSLQREILTNRYLRLHPHRHTYYSQLWPNLKVSCVAVWSENPKYCLYCSLHYNWILQHVAVDVLNCQAHRCVTQIPNKSETSSCWQNDIPLSFHI
jgi:hypothetical protein